jgi:hypothetical protein
VTWEIAGQRNIFFRPVQAPLRDIRKLIQERSGPRSSLCWTSAPTLLGLQPSLTFAWQGGEPMFNAPML